MVFSSDGKQNGISRIKRDFKIKQLSNDAIASRTSKNNNFARAAHFCIFLCCFCRLRREIIKCLISRFTEENVNKQRRNFISLSELGYGPLEFKFRRVRLYLTK